MHLSKLYDPSGHDARVRYAIATILRGRVVNEWAFLNCFEMTDRDDVIRTILRRGLRNAKLMAALKTSRIVNFRQWLLDNPDLWDRYHTPAPRQHPMAFRADKPAR
jgi:hypothetical protein